MLRRTHGFIDSTDVRVEVIDGAWTPGLGGYYADDLLAIQAGAQPDGLLYRGTPLSPGHAQVRAPALAVLVRLAGADGRVAWGDVVTPQYSGVAGRDLPIDPEALAPQLRRALDALVAEGPVTFGEGCAVLEAATVDGRPLHTGVRYGFSQALLLLAARAAGCAPAQLLHALAGTDAPARMVPVYAQSGEERQRNVDKMILKRVDVLPHGLINSTDAFGVDGQTFLDYAKWVRDRVRSVGADDYQPLLHFDVYGMLGRVMDGDPGRMAAFCADLQRACAPLRVQLESPAYGADTPATADLLRRLRDRLREAGTAVAIVADDWCNTLEDIRAFVTQGAADVIQIKMPDLGSLTNAVEAARICRDHGTAIFIGGSCTETDASARLSAQLAMAVGADQVLAKPGMGVDEGVLIVRNEMSRTLLDLHAPSSHAPKGRS